MKKRLTGLSVPAGIDEQYFAECAAGGLDCLELSLRVEELADPLPFPRFHEMTEKYGLWLRSFHLPFTPFAEYDISTTDEQARRMAVQRQTDRLEKIAEAGIKLAVIHPSGEPIAPQERAQRMAQAKRSLSELASVANAHGILLAVEDLPRTCLGCNSAEILELIGNDPRLGVCFDTNHLLNEDPCDFVRAVGDRIVTTHVSDYDFINERHWLPGEGDIDWNALLRALEDVGYDGPLVYEIDSSVTIKTMRRERALRPSDMAQNSRELLEGTPFTLRGERIPNLGLWGPRTDQRQ